MPVRERSVATGGALIATIGLLLASGCTQQGPSEFNAGVREDFVASCVEQQVAADAPEAGATAVCECAYDNISENVEFGDFKSANGDLEEDPDSTLPPVIASQVEPCTGGAADQPGPTTTPAPGATPTPGTSAPAGPGPAPSISGPATTPVPASP